jgi:hypothetical protein
MSQALTNPSIGEDMKTLSNVPLLVKGKSRPSTSLAYAAAALDSGNRGGTRSRPSSAMSFCIDAAGQGRKGQQGRGGEIGRMATRGGGTPGADVRWWSGGGEVRKLTATQSNELLTQVEGQIRAGPYMGGGWSRQGLTSVKQDVRARGGDGGTGMATRPHAEWGGTVQGRDKKRGDAGTERLRGSAAGVGLDERLGMIASTAAKQVFRIGGTVPCQDGMILMTDAQRRLRPRDKAWWPSGPLLDALRERCRAVAIARGGAGGRARRNEVVGEKRAGQRRLREPLDATASLSAVAAMGGEEARGGVGRSRYGHNIKTRPRVRPATSLVCGWGVGERGVWWLGGGERER